MRRVPLYLLAAVAAATGFAQGPAGPIVKRPRPAASSRPSPQPPPRRIGERPVEHDRPEVAYVPPTDPVLLLAIEANEEFDQKLPNFLCRQFMTRSRSRNLGKKWKDEDVVEAEVLIDRKMLSDLAVHDLDAFGKIVETARQHRG